VDAPMAMSEAEAQPASEIYCAFCGYDLRDIDSLKCPECGQAIDRSMLGQSVLPWLHRGRLGTLRAFWRTVRLVSFHPGKLGREMNCPARLGDASSFRRLVVIHALVPLGAVLTLVWLRAFEPFWVLTDPLGSLLTMLSVAVGWACLGLFLWGMTGA